MIWLNKKCHENFIDDSKWEIYGICGPSTYSCIDIFTKPCPVMRTEQNTAASAIHMKKLKENVNMVVTS